MAAAALGVLATTAAAQQKNPFRWSGTLESGQTLRVRAVSGDIHVQPTTGNTVQIVAEKHGRSGDFDEVEVRVVKDGDGVTLCSVYYPEDNPDGCNTGGHHGWGRHRSTHVSVDYTVELPAGVDLVAETVSGDVEARHLRSNVKASSVSGDVTVSTTGRGWGSTVSGDIDVAMSNLEWKDLSFSTVSGDVTLRLPKTFAAAIEFQSVSGDFDSDFDVTLNHAGHRWLGANIHGTIGGGGDRTLKVKTVSGDLRIEKM
jgi:DUF4097 and DUF4098 domain-containing protein YvlB